MAGTAEKLFLFLPWQCAYQIKKLCLVQFADSATILEKGLHNERLTCLAGKAKKLFLFFPGQNINTTTIHKKSLNNKHVFCTAGMTEKPFFFLLC